MPQCVRRSLPRCRFVWGETDFCHVVPQTGGSGAPASTQAGYKVVCHDDNSATISFHDTASCEAAGAVEQLVATDACIANAAGWGSMSFSVACNPNNPVGGEDVAPGNFLAQWMEFDTCDPTHQVRPTAARGTQA